MKQSVTKKCIVCGRKAATYSGHVHEDQKIITVGWCRGCVSTKMASSLLAPIKGCNMKIGCFGIYKKRYGLIQENL